MEPSYMCCLFNERWCCGFYFVFFLLWQSQMYASHRLFGSCDQSEYVSPACSSIVESNENRCLLILYLFVFDWRSAHSDGIHGRSVLCLVASYFFFVFLRFTFVFFLCIWWVLLCVAFQINSHPNLLFIFWSCFNLLLTETLQNKLNY